MRKGFQSRSLASAFAAACVVGLSAGTTLAQQVAPPGGTPANPPSAEPTLALVEPGSSLIITPEPPAGWNTRPRPTLITNPSWARRPNVEFPAAALANNINHGRVTLRCTVEPTGALINCAAIEETPTGQGFAESALSGTQNARISPRLVDGAAVGASVHFTINYEMPIDDPVIIEASPKR